MHVHQCACGRRWKTLVDRKGRGKKERERKRKRERKGTNGTKKTYSRRAVVIGGNFIILRHYPRYCNAIKLDTLRTPSGTGECLGLLPLEVSSSSFRFLREDVGTRFALLRTSSPCPNNFTQYTYISCPI